MVGIDPKSKISITEWSLRQVAKYKQQAKDYPFHYPLYFGPYHDNPAYSAALDIQKQAPEWCEQNFETGTWMHEFDIDGTVDFRFKSEDQLMRFKLRWHK